MADIYFIDAVAKILELLKLNFGEEFKSFYNGDPLLIGESSLPAISVSKISGTNTLGPTGFDEVTEVIMIKLITNKKEDYGASDDVDLTDNKIRNWMEGLDQITGLYVDQCVMSIVRTNITISQTVLDHDEEVAYGVVPRDQKSDFWTSEAHLKLTLRRYIQIPGRV